MSEDNTKNPDTDFTNPLPFEEFVRQHLALLIKQGNELREQQAKSQEEIIERFLQLSRQIRELDERLGRVEERLGKVDEQVSNGREELQDLDDKVGAFIKDQLRMKREWRKFQEQEEERRTA
ncbi:MAG: hypothetical protein ACREA2_00915 [Blastocatellia bacterium]